MCREKVKPKLYRVMTLTTISLLAWPSRFAVSSREPSGALQALASGLTRIPRLSLLTIQTR